MVYDVSIHAPARGATDCAQTMRARTYMFQSTPPRGGRRVRSDRDRRGDNVFQSTPPRGGRQHRSAGCPHDSMCFNPRPRAGGDHSVTQYRSRSMQVSIHAPARGATVSSYRGTVGSSSFNPRPRAGGDHTRTRPSQPSHRFQSTPPRGGRRIRRQASRSLVRVSIHAPARGATAASSAHAPDIACFNPRPRAGGDLRLCVQRHYEFMFQSTPPRGGRPADAAHRIRSIHVSIHAPARGATLDRTACAVDECCFNPRPRAGGDAEACGHPCSVSRFNPRPRAGGDLACHGDAVSSRSFNPRPRAGGDPEHRASIIAMTVVSIHAPARGATRDGHRMRVIPSPFQSTPPRGGRLSGSRCIRHRTFQSTPPRGGRPLVACQDSVEVFQSTPPRGGRHQIVARLRSACNVSIHAPARGATVLLDREAADAVKFQSTPPRGGRPDACRRMPTSRRCFNPRPRAGGDHAAVGYMATIVVSIHAPARGATRPARMIDGRIMMFQSTPPRGGRPAIGIRSLDRVVHVSIHAPARGATVESRDGRHSAHACFNPRPRAGGDHRPCAARSIG